MKVARTVAYLADLRAAHWVAKSVGHLAGTTAVGSAGMWVDSKAAPRVVQWEPQTVETKVES